MTVGEHSRPDTVDADQAMAGVTLHLAQRQ
jgi:hypothetical protein